MFSHSPYALAKGELPGAHGYSSMALLFGLCAHGARADYQTLGCRLVG